MPPPIVKFAANKSAPEALPVCAPNETFANYERNFAPYLITSDGNTILT